MNSILTVVEKVAVIMVLIFVGYIITKKGILTSRGESEINSILVKIVTPCVIINSFLNAESGLSAYTLIMAIIISALGIVLNIIVSQFIFRKETAERRPVLRFATVFSNVGFMGLPLVKAIVGDEGVVYASFAISIFNVISWTYGFRLMNKEEKINFKTLLFNPGIIGLAIGLPLYLLKVNLPPLIAEPISYLDAINTPLAMIIVGSNVARIDIKAFVSDFSVYMVSIFRLLICPLIFLGALLLIRPNSTLLMSNIVQAATPTAASTVMFAMMFKKDAELGSKCVAVTTVFSIITIPIVVILAQFLVQLLY